LADILLSFVGLEMGAYKMNLIEALKTRLPLRRPIAKHCGSGKDGWLDSEYVIFFLVENKIRFHHFIDQIDIIDRDDLLADDWEIKS
jgi:hypothetical protein